MYKVLVTGSKHGDSTQVFRIKQYKQCEQGNHLTSETKEVEYAQGKQINQKPAYYSGSRSKSGKPLPT